jgi:hypothetical protein
VLHSKTEQGLVSRSKTEPVLEQGSKYGRELELGSSFELGQGSMCELDVHEQCEHVSEGSMC